MDKTARQTLQAFIQEKLNGNLDEILTFDFKTLRESAQFGCPGRRFDGDDTEIVRAICVVLWEDLLPELSMASLGDREKYRGDTMNSFHTMFGREIADHPGFFAGLEKYAPAEELRERVREFGNACCSTVGNFVVLPNLYVRGTTLNMYRGTNGWRDFFDRFLIQLRIVLCGEEAGDPLLAELVNANAFCFARFEGREGFPALARGLLLEDYCDREYVPQIVFPMNYHWKDPADKETYFRDAMSYLDNAERIIRSRGRRIRDRLEAKL